MADDDQKGQDGANAPAGDEGSNLDAQRVSEWLKENKGIDNIDGLASALEKEREAAKEAKRALRAFEGFDPDEYQRLKEAAEEAEAAKLSEVERAEAKSQRQAEKYEKELEQYKSALAEREIDGELIRSLATAGVMEEDRDTVAAYLLRKAEASVEWDSGKPVGYMGGMPIREYVEEYAKTSHAARYIAASGASGSGAKGGGGGGDGSLASRIAAAENAGDWATARALKGELLKQKIS